MKYLVLATAVGIGAGAVFMVGNLYYHSKLHADDMPLVTSSYPIIAEAKAVIYPTKGNAASGVVTFAAAHDGLHITARVTGLTPGNHGFHIHEFGNCACDDAVCAGGHFDPMHKQHHGAPDAAMRHAGDLGNLMADEKGEAVYDYTDKEITLNGPHSIIGRSVIIHAQADDFKTQPTGNAGARVGCGVIGISKKV